MTLHALICGLQKIADHADDRLRERTGLQDSDLAELRRRVRRQRSKLDPSRTYHYKWEDRGTAVIGPVGKRKKHVVKTVLSPWMAAPGTPLPEEGGT